MASSPETFNQRKFWAGKGVWRPPLLMSLEEMTELEMVGSFCEVKGKPNQLGHINIGLGKRSDSSCQSLHNPIRKVL